MMKPEKLDLVSEWDKTFPKSKSVNHKKVTFVNRYGITLAVDMYTPKNEQKKFPALAVCGPFGAVKEQCSGLYAQTMAERGYLTIAFEPSFTGESGGQPRYMASSDINTEDFMAAVDFLSVQDNVDSDKIGIIGIPRPFQSLSSIITRTNVRVNSIISGRASTASVATLAKNGVGRSGFTCRAASKSGEYPHRKNRAFRLTAETLCFHFWDSPKPLFTSIFDNRHRTSVRWCKRRWYLQSALPDRRP